MKTSGIPPTSNRHAALPAEYFLGGTVVRYTRCARTGVVEMSCFPTALRDKLAPPRETVSGPHIDNLPARWRPQYAHEPEWLVQIKLADSPEPGMHQAGRSLRGSVDLAALAFENQECIVEADGSTTVVTRCAHPKGFRLLHVLRWCPGDPFFQVHTEFVNCGNQPLTLEYFPSFSLGGVTPFHPGEAPERLFLHRFRATWSAEGRHERIPLESLSLERSWIGLSRRTERFGQAGSLPVRGFFPWAALEDSGVGVLWGVQLPAPASWHLEVARCKDRVTLSGGLPSRDFGEWWLTVQPGGAVASPPVFLACVEGDVDDLCHALTRAQVPSAQCQPASEQDLPFVFNEWCSSWGEPTHEYLVETARRLAQTRTRILVIDDGWAEKPPGQDIQFNGDWVVDRRKFPDGLKATADAIRAHGLIPGLWFELECVTQGTKAFEAADRLLARGGRVIQVGSRRFWNFRDPLTLELLAEKVIARLRDDGFGYLKIDYNETLPSGVDGAASPGEGLLRHIAAVQSFLERIRREIPGIVIENCSSGGHRLEPSFQAICAMGCFSDSHETVSIPIIAANLHRLILPRQSQVWCVLHAHDSLQRLRYGLAATFLGRMALSGDLKDLHPWQLAEIVAAQDFLAGSAEIIRDGRSRLHRHMGQSWNEPHGWQAVVRATGREALVVVHTFANAPGEPLRIPLPPGLWRLADSYGLPAEIRLDDGCLTLPPLPDFSGAAVRLASWRTLHE